MQEPKRCVHCKHSKPAMPNDWTLKCWHPEVVSYDSWALSTMRDGEAVGADCRAERDKGFMGRCGMRGKLFEPKS